MAKGEAFSLDKRVALVVGSTAGIGRAVAEAFAEAGARVAINGRNKDRVAAVAATIPGAVEAPFDATNHRAAERAIDAIASDLGRFDILVYSVGMRDRRSVAEIEPDDFRQIMETNTVSAYQVARLATVRMTRPECGRLIFISSTAAKRPFRGDPVYASSKAAMESLARSLAFELGATGMTANVIAPGFVATEFNQTLAEEDGIRTFVETRIPARRWARPEEVANAAVFLASDAASYVNGHVLAVDAGMSVIL
ncbi:MAG: SDR family oxidoreductase [Alphaproteobacteria bacterium]|nr:SDR family oxidoreductase [Alphaproteobacteria bacterium]